MEFRSGFYVIDTSKYEHVLGRKYAIIGGIKINFELLRQILQIGLGAGYMREHERYYYLYAIPTEGSFNIRLKFSSNQLIVPYFGGGGDYFYIKEKGVFLDQNEQLNTSILHSQRSGYHMNFGFQILLNRLDIETSKRFDEKFGVNGTYITIEARYSDLTNFGSIKNNETDLSGWFYYIGLLFEF